MKMAPEEEEGGVVFVAVAAGVVRTKAIVSCLRIENVVLPKDGYFAVSAATGDLSDDHDVLHILTSSLWAPGQHFSVGSQAASDEQKLNQEYYQYQLKLEQQKVDYKKEHPDAKKSKDDVEDSCKLHRKLDEIIGRQEWTLSLVTMVQQGVVSSVQVQPRSVLGKHHLLKV
ncbi:hypothetical protein FQA39_LY08550 [Lamprigera yunnana]|nr:hypothetical protein FQA39_LY08550 [Lamprigera yunnana]